MREEEIRAEHFRQAEASFLLEGLDSSNDEHYQALKARIIAGDIDFDDAIRQTVEHYKALAGASAPELASAK
jgi:hypothetical protein